MNAEDEALLKELGALARQEQRAPVLSDISESTIAATTERIMHAMAHELSPLERLLQQVRRLKKRISVMLVLQLALVAATAWCVALRPKASHYELSVLHAGGVMRSDTGSSLRAGGRSVLLMRPQTQNNHVPDFRAWREGSIGLVDLPLSAEHDASGAVRLAFDLPADTQRVVVSTCAKDAKAVTDCRGQRWSVPVEGGAASAVNEPGEGERLRPPSVRSLIAR